MSGGCKSYGNIDIKERAKEYVEKGIDDSIVRFSEYGKIVFQLLEIHHHGGKELSASVIKYRG